ncbi:MAG: hypothetical protein K0S32_2469 [Bacteroidetes bacterium]|jgi:hypothetical protein|nr:hypothetical protein [Bacteroidota bacterium]
MNRILLIALVLFSIQLNAKHHTLDLQKAIDLRLVKATANSLGSHQGYCMNMHLKNLGTDSLVILVEAGRRLNSLDEKNQDILVIHEEMIFLGKLEDKWFKVKGYCCQANNHSPSQNAKYDINTLADSNLVKLAQFLNKNSFDPHVEQQAIWSISDNRPTAHIAGKNDSLGFALRSLVSTIKGEPIPWYTVISRTFVYSSGAMQNFPQLLKGKLNYNNDKDAYVTLFIYDSKGHPVCLIRDQWLKACSNKDYELNIPVKGLAKGKYSIGLKTAEKELTRKEFEI